MSKPIPYTEWRPDVQWLPAIDWNVKFFGAHEQQVAKGWTVPQESHIGFEINLVLGGVQETIMGENRYLLREGDILLIPPGFKHVNRCVSEGGMRYFCAHFNVDDPAFRQEMVKHDRILFPAGSKDNDKLRNIVDQWIYMVRRKGGHTSGDRFRLQALLFELFGLLAQTVPGDMGQQEAAPPAAVHYAKAIAEAMKARFDPHRPGGDSRAEEPPPRVEEIAASLGISPGYGLEVFRKVYGVSPRHYLSELKLHEAKVLMQQPDLTLGEIANRLGYAHLSHFSRQFKRWTGMSPLQYRQSRPDERGGQV